MTRTALLGAGHSNQNMTHHRKYNLKNGGTIKQKNTSSKTERDSKEDPCTHLAWTHDMLLKNILVQLLDPHTYTVHLAVCLFHSNPKSHPNCMGTNIITL